MESVITEREKLEDKLKERLKGMEEQARILGGTLTVESAKGGMRVKVLLRG